MFCFRCGEKMIVRNKTYFCEKGDMPLSEHLDNKLSAVFEDKNERSFPDNTERIPPRKLFCLNARCPNPYQTYFNLEICPACHSTLRETTFYCPQCGIPMDNKSENSSANISCVVCQKNLTGELRYQIVELHPHKPYPNDFKPFKNQSPANE
jgi:predicted RNA-binding Zn-ribbon protein involved in translation (DUF1610 family)